MFEYSLLVWLVNAALALVSYVWSPPGGALAIVFPVCMILLGEDGPHIENGVYCLWNHGFIREITAAEYEALLKVEARMFFGHMLAFTGMPVAFFSARKKIWLL